MMKSGSFKVIMLVLFLATANYFLLRTCNRDKSESETIYTETKNSYVLTNKDIALTISRTGGFFTGFVVNNNPVNPFGWALKPEQMPKINQPHIFAGHFLCTGRWGEPSPGEVAAGVPYNGEVNTNDWQIIQTDKLEDGTQNIVMECMAPIEKLDVERTIIMPENGHWFAVNETFSNNLPIGRLTNFVQHGTVFAPFLTSEMIVNTNAGKGFDQQTPIHQLENSSFDWPNGLLASGSRVDLRNPQTNEGFVTTHLFPNTDTLGWVTAYNPQMNLLLGYIFPTTDYPWFNYWHNNVDGQPYVRGLEFGTTGMGKPYEVLLSENVVFYGKPSWVYMDAGEVISKSWLCFQLQLSNKIQQIESIQWVGENIIITATHPDGTQGLETIKIDKSVWK